VEYDQPRMVRLQVLLEDYVDTYGRTERLLAAYEIVSHVWAASARLRWYWERRLSQQEFSSGQQWNQMAKRDYPTLQVCGQRSWPFLLAADGHPSNHLANKTGTSVKAHVGPFHCALDSRHSWCYNRLVERCMCLHFKAAHLTRKQGHDASNRIGRRIY
jgi:hypothetical protein